MSEQERRLAAEIDALQIGDGISYKSYTDIFPCTIIYRSPGGGRIKAQEDNAKLLNAHELKFVPGGFAAHCLNQEVQKYEYSRNYEGRIVTFTRRMWEDSNGNRRVRWKLRGSKTRDVAGNVYPGRKKFHDYNY